MKERKKQGTDDTTGLPMRWPRKGRAAVQVWLAVEYETIVTILRERTFDYPQMNNAVDLNLADARKARLLLDAAIAEAERRGLK